MSAQGHGKLGELHQRLGRRDQARAHLSKATTMFREMDMHEFLRLTTVGRMSRA